MHPNGCFFNYRRILSMKKYLVKTTSAFIIILTLIITATYRSAISNGTWVQNAPTNGTASVTVIDTKLIVPQTGGYVMYLYIAGAASLVLGGVMLVIIKRSKKNSK